jgi:hypothetical protein
VTYESYPNSAHNSRAITLGEHENLAAPLGLSGLTTFGAGILPLYADSTGRQVKLRAGVSALLRGTRFNNTSETTIAIGANSSGNTRIDLVVLRLDRSTYVVTPTVIAGTASATPVAPSPVRNEQGGSPDYFDQPLAEVTVLDGATTITATQVKSRAWWISGSGYVGYSTAQPPVVAGVVWRESDTGFAYIGSTGGTWQRVYDYSGQVDLPARSGWSAQDFNFTRDGQLITMTMAVEKTGSTLSASSSAVVGQVSGRFLPARKWLAPYVVTGTYHSSFLTIGTTGLITLNNDGVHSIPAGNVAIATATYPAAD